MRRLFGCRSVTILFAPLLLVACQPKKVSGPFDLACDIGFAECIGCNNDVASSNETDSGSSPDTSTKDQTFFDHLDGGTTDFIHADQQLQDIQTFDLLADQDSETSPLDTTTPDESHSDTLDQSPQDDVDIAGPPPLFDLQLIGDPTTAQCIFENPHTVLKDGVLLDVWHVKYYSFEAVDGQLKPILIQGYAAKPAGQNGPMPGIIQAHGLGGFAQESHATGVASLTGMFVLAYTGPGGGSEPLNTSEGLPSSAQNGYHMFDVLADPRTTWFWGHSVAAMRGITCLTTRPEVDPARIGMTGFSAGGVATLLVAGADPRLKAGVPLSGTLAWNVAVESPQAWQNNLLTLAGLNSQSPEWKGLINALISPQAMLASSSTNLLMVNGTTDEFFPLTAHMATFAALPLASSRISLAANFDHGCYQISGLETPATIEDRASLRANGAQRMWFRHQFGTDNTYAYLPAMPQLQATSIAGATYLTAIVDSGGASLDVESVQVWWSGDDCWSFISQELSGKGNGLYDAIVPLVLPANSVYFADVVYHTSGLFPERFSLSSIPVIPPDLVPHIRQMDSCL